MKKNKKQGDIFSGFKPEQENRPISQADVCRILKGKVISEEEYAEEVLLLKMDGSGEPLVEAVRKSGVFWWVTPDSGRVAWYKKVFTEDKAKLISKLKI